MSFTGATNSLRLKIFNPSWLREIAVAFQSLAFNLFPCQSEWLTSLGITRYQTVVLLLSTLYITTMPKSFCFQSFSVLIILLIVAAIFIVVNTKATDGQSNVSFHFQSCLMVSVPSWISHLIVSQSQTLSSSTWLFINSTLHINCSLSENSKKHANHDPNCSPSASQT